MGRDVGPDDYEICAALLGTVVDDLAPGRLVIALLLATVVIALWVTTSETDRLDRLAERAGS